MGASSGLAASSFIQASSSAASGISQAGAIKAQGAYESSQASTNSRLAALQAEDAATRGNTAAQEKARSDAQLLGQQRAGLAAQGVSLSSGSAASIQSGTIAMSELDQMTIRNNASREAMGYRTQSLNYDGQSKMASLAAETNSRNSILTGGMNALAFTTKGYGQWADKVGAKSTSLKANGYAGSDRSDFSDFS